MKKQVAVAVATKTSGQPKSSRYAELKKMLEDRRRELVAEIGNKKRECREEGQRGVMDASERAEAELQDHVRRQLTGMRSETLQKFDVALQRLHEGTYGDCFECGEEISQARLRALPFAIRCRECEEARETAEARENERQRQQRSSGNYMFLPLDPA